MLLFSCYEKNRASIVKLIGSALVLALAFAANNAVTYGLAIFIVATLVTDLDFLEKLAALFWNRDKYWEYQLKKQSPDEETAKAAKEADEIISANMASAEQASPDTGATEANNPIISLATAAPAPRNSEAKPRSSATKSNPYLRKAIKSMQMTNRILGFESQVARAITSKDGPLEGGVASTGFVLKGRDRDFHIDLIVKIPGVHYVAEIKYATAPQIIKSAEMRVREVAKVYESYLKEKGLLDVVVIPLLIVSHLADCSRISSGLSVLKFDEGLNAFV